MLSLPSSNSPLRSLFNVAELAAMASPENRQKMPTFRDVRAKVVGFFQADRSARELNAIVVRADGQLWLVRFGRRGGWKRLWNFGQLVELPSVCGGEDGRQTNGNRVNDKRYISI